MRYVIADIEATGLDVDREMIEIAFIVWEDGVVVDVFESLINPLVPVSTFITEFTDITHRQLENAPKFYEIADRVLMRLQDAVFVSHNVEFDLPMLEKAFTQMGIDFKMKSLCTLRLAQELVPGLKSYTLEDLCRFFHIKTKIKHRALPDAQAAMRLFLELRELASPKGKNKITYLPQHEKILKHIPAKAGVLYFKDETQKLLKALACADMSEVAMRELRVRAEARELLEKCSSVEFEVTGSELIAQFKSARFTPKKAKFVIVLCTTAEGEQHFMLKPFHPRFEALWTFESKNKAMRFLKNLEAQFPRSHFAWREGGKTKQEIYEHNKVVERILKESSFPAKNLLLWGPGRHAEEWSYILIQEGRLYGWSYDEKRPEEVIGNPLSIVRRRKSSELQELAVRYFKEHRQKRKKNDQWRELKEMR
jgi:DNA polymerase III subunit epsilon